MKQFFFNQGEKGNVEIIGRGRHAAFADQTLFAKSHPDKFVQSMASIHVKDDEVFFTVDGNPFYGGSFLKESKEQAIAYAEEKGFVFDEESKVAFLAA